MGEQGTEFGFDGGCDGCVPGVVGVRGVGHEVRMPVNQLFAGSGTTTLYGNTNLSPHFPYAAQTWIAMWDKHSGEQLDGAIALDPSALSYLLRVTGPAHLADGAVVSASNVVALTQSTVYARFPRLTDQARRKAYLLAIARATSRRILDSTADSTGLLRAGARAAGERRILVYSADPKIQPDIAQTALSGEIPRTAKPYAGLAVVNDGGNKLDYYLDRSLTWSASGCGSTRKVTVTIRLHNGAPASGLSPYVTARSDHPGYPVRPGDNRLEVSYYATAGAQMSSVQVAGKPSGAALGSDLGHPVFTLDVEVPRGMTPEIVFQLREPRGRSRPLVLRQPLVRPLHVTVEQDVCG